MMLMEKISDENFRYREIEDLREKVLDEIKTKRTLLIRCTESYGLDGSYMWSAFAKEFLALDLLEKYFSDSDLFNEKRYVHYGTDKVVYNLHINTIDNMLRDSCNVVFEWLHRLNMDDGYDHIRDYLKADYFERIFAEWF